ncbi:LysM peptidoglycan-binding domain-containing protein [Saccharopolyspora hirsuta]|uniref:LysM peptidoglycan-binding domain-containing protein n=1 Tax=Saccharopolyspora hirsuta TaxID=1837 RepID=A0A5M7BAN0_SACHI|nr:LysM peptidoglycan-binding domain-containing protein [Saccharopolyspora hirsuta]KAA5825438.1 LysM peptidoglycan-binding domain-containing protein [Saccharopolyspora hirsuta]
MNRIRLAAAGLGLLVYLVGLPTILTITSSVVTVPDLSWPEIDTSPWAPTPVHEQLLVWAEDTWQTLRIELRLDGALILAIYVAAWIAWAVMLWWTLCDTVLLLRYGARNLANRLTVTGPRGWITALVASTVLSLNTPTASAAPATAQIAATAPLDPTPGSGALPAPGSSTLPLGSGGHPDPTPPPEPSTPTHLPDTVRPELPRYHVARGDTLWDIAKRHLTSGYRWRDIQALNADRLGTPRHLHPGWTLLLPADAHDLPTPAPIPDNAQWITTQPGDTLSSLAEHHLGDASRWEEIYRLNVHHPQPDGRVLRDPDRVFPDWHLALPHHAPPPRDAGTDPVRVETPPAAPHPAASEHREDTDEGGVVVGDGVFLSFGLAAAVAAGLAVARKRYRRHRHATRGLDYPVSPTVYRLALAHLHATQPALDTPTLPPAPAPSERETGDASGESGGWVIELGVREGTPVRVDLSATGGLGFTGVGVVPAMRALLLFLLLHRPHLPRVVVHQPVLETLFPDRPAPPAVEIVDDLAVAVAKAAQHPSSGSPVVIVLSTPPPNVVAALQAAVTDGGLIPLVLGPCSEGGGLTLAVDEHGTVTAATPEAWSHLLGTRVFTATTTATDDLLILDRHSTPGTDHTAPSTDHADTEPSPAEQLLTPPATDEPHMPDVETPTCADPPATEQTVPQEHEHTGTPADLGEPVGAGAVLSVRVFGPITLHHQPEHGKAKEITGRFAPRQRELLAYLAAHPDGISRDTLISDLWHHSPPDRPTNALNTALSRLRTALSRATHGELAEIITTGHGQLRLRPDLVDTDFSCFTRAEHTARTAPTDTARRAALQEIVELYRGELGADLEGEWVHTVRHAAQRTAINAVSELARRHVATDPQHTLDLLETATRFDPYNEHLYRDIMRLQDRLGAHDAIPRTLTLLQARLREIDLAPAPETVAIAQALQQRHTERLTTQLSSP